MLQFLSSRLSLPIRVLLVSVCAVPPVALLLFLFLNQTFREDRFTAREIKGAAYIAEIWPAMLTGRSASGPIREAQAFQAQREAQAFAAAGVQGRATSGAALLQAVADSSNLTLDTDLDSFYAMDAATVALPRMLAAVGAVAADEGRDQVLAVGRVQAEEASALRDLNEAVDHDPDGRARAAIAGLPARLSSAFDAFERAPGDAGLRAALVAEMDRAWRADDHELTRLLQARQTRLHSRLIASLSLIALALAIAIGLAIAMTQGLTARLRALLLVMDRLNLGDTRVDIPYLGDRNETGRIAATLSAFRRGLIAAEGEKRNAQTANDAVRQSEARYRILADNASDVIIHYDPMFHPLYVSPSVRQLGYDAKELLELAFLDLVHPEDQHLVIERRRAIRAGETIRRISARLRRASGEWVWFESTLSAIVGEDGAPVGFVANLRDISERRAAEQAVIDSEARYRLLADNASDIIIHYDLAFQTLYISPSVAQLGHDPHVLLGKTLLDLVHPDDQPKAAARRQTVLAGQPVRPTTGRIRRADGDWAWFESTLAAVVGEGGAISGFVSVLRDVNERRTVEQAVIDSEARYRMLADNASDVILHYDLQFHPLYISPSISQLGYDPHSLQERQHCLDLVHPDDQITVTDRQQAALRGEPTPPISARLGRANGEWVWFESTLTPIVGADGAISSFISTLRDISERRTAEQAVIESEARYRLLAENISDVLLRYDADQRIQYVSPSVSQWGYTPEDFIGQRAGVFVHPDDERWVAERRAAMMRGDMAESVEARIRRADGSWTWIESNPAVVRDKDGAVLSVVLALRDIDRRKRTEAALVESETRYRMLADNTSDIIQRFNAEGVVEYMSPSVRQLGYEPEFFIGRGTALLVDNEDMPQVARRRDDLLAGRQVPPLESRVRRADGGMIWLESRPSPILDDHGKLLGVVNVMRDVTARKAAEAAMQELDLELRRVARASALGAFAASLAHEINQPLAAAAISGEAALRWLSSDPVNYERGVQAMKRTVDDVRRAADVVGRMRAMVAKEEPRRADFDAVDAVREVLALTERERDRFGVRIRPGLDPLPVIVHGDRVQFQQVMINLILNGIEAMRDTPERERVLVVRAEGTEGQLDLAVEDRGPGVDPDKREQIFESLFTTKIGGTGLGLHISRSIVETHGGRLWVEPAAQSGAIFKVRMPATLQRTGLACQPREAALK